MSNKLQRKRLSGVNSSCHGVRERNEGPAGLSVANSGQVPE
uniref:Uncharacterized protein n=1 Tax=Arundo donax TaxID=35708 RepID=A0A0A9AR74_ARUDO